MFCPGRSLSQQGGSDGSLGVHVVGDGGASIDDLLGKFLVVLGDHSQRVEDKVGQLRLLVRGAAVMGVDGMHGRNTAKAKN